MRRSQIRLWRQPLVICETRPSISHCRLLPHGAIKREVWQFQFPSTWLEIRVYRPNCCQLSPHQAGSNAADETLRLGQEFTGHLPHPSQVFHALELNAIHLALSRQNLLANWQSEIEVASFNTISRSPYQKDYDALVDVWIGDKTARFALEYERTLKGVKHYERIKAALQAEHQVGCVLYLASGVEVLIQLVRELDFDTSKLVFACSRDFADTLLDTPVIAGRDMDKMKFRELLQ